MSFDFSSRLKKLQLRINRDPDITVKNCQFLFECKAQWSDLNKTKNRNIRFCNQCRKDVHLCITNESLARAISFNHCVALYKGVSNSLTVGIPKVIKKPAK